jgi:hypothetical protein
MCKVLEAINYGHFVINDVKTMYNGIQSCILNNGHASEYFQPIRGIRQGCPIAANLFILVVEVLANIIRSNPNISGITIDGGEYKLSQYTGDTCLFITEVASLPAALTIFEAFTKCSGRKVNKEKSEAIWIGASSNYCHKPLGLKWTQFANYLGTYISNNSAEAGKLNFKEKKE